MRVEEVWGLPLAAERAAPSGRGGRGGPSARGSGRGAGAAAGCRTPVRAAVASARREASRRTCFIPCASACLRRGARSITPDLQLLADRDQKDPPDPERELATTEAHRDLSLSPLSGISRGADLLVDVVVGDLGDTRISSRHGLLLLLRVLAFCCGRIVLSKSPMRATGLDVGSDLDQVVSLFLRLRERARSRNNPKLLAIGSEKANGRNTDRFVDPEFGRGYRETSVIGVKMPLAARPLPVKELQLRRAYHRAK